MNGRSGDTPLIIAGMHRSGTSFVASWLQHAGIHLGDRLMPPNIGNELGYFENVDFVGFHERLLHANGHDPSGWMVPITTIDTDKAHAEGLALLESNARRGPWGWKDPRTTLFLDFWSALVPNARYVFIYREPAEVVDSLLRRGDPTILSRPELAARAWSAHNSSLLRFTRMNRSRCILANVSVIARDPHRLGRLIADRFGIPMDIGTDSTYEPSAMRTLALTSAKAVLLRHLLPECERLFADLEIEADFAASVARGPGVMARRARDAFFAEWALQSGETNSIALAEASRAADTLQQRISVTRERIERYEDTLRAGTIVDRWRA